MRRLSYKSCDQEEKTISTLYLCIFGLKYAILLAAIASQL